MSVARRSRPAQAACGRAAPPKPRYTLPSAREARGVLLAELRRHGFARTADAYERGEIREKQVASRVGCIGQRAERKGERVRAKIARGVMLLASYLHEGKHERGASPDALRVFWSHYERVHGAGGKYPLRENPEGSAAQEEWIVAYQTAPREPWRFRVPAGSRGALNPFAAIKMSQAEAEDLAAKIGASYAPFGGRAQARPAPDLPPNLRRRARTNPARPPARPCVPARTADGFAYHVTGSDALADILDDGRMRPFSPSHGSDQAAWPDGGRERRVYFARTAAATDPFYDPDRGGRVLLRVALDRVALCDEGRHLDLYSRRAVPVSAVEKQEGGRWVPLAKQSR